MVDEISEQELLSEALRPHLKNAPAAAELFGRILSRIKEILESEPGGKAGAIPALSDAISAIFPYSQTYKAARDLWELHLRGLLFWENEPDQLLSRAIEQGIEAAAKTCQPHRSKGRAANSRAGTRSGPSRSSR